MKGSRRWTIAIRPAEGQQPRKITKIISLNGAGFSVLAPYHKAKNGYLCKVPVDPEVQGVFNSSWSETIGFIANDRVKLSYHTDGFAQFSSETSGRITSGRDPVTGEAKGLGLYTHSLDSPVWSGPSVGMTLWGIDDFEETKDGDKLLVFEPSEFYYRGCTPDEANAWNLSIYVFPIGVVPPLRFQQGCALLDVALYPMNGNLHSIVQLKIIHLPGEKVYLGLFVIRMATNFPSKSGWIFNGPGNYTRFQRGHVLMGVYPRDVIPVEGRDSLDRAQSSTPGEESQG